MEGDGACGFEPRVFACMKVGQVGADAASTTGRVLGFGFEVAKL